MSTKVVQSILNFPFLVSKAVTGAGLVIVIMPVIVEGIADDLGAIIEVSHIILQSDHLDHTASSVSQISRYTALLYAHSNQAIGVRKTYART